MRPLQQKLLEAIGDVSSAQAAVDAFERAFRRDIGTQAGVAAEAHLQRVQAHHKRRIIKTLQKAFRVDIRPFLDDEVIKMWMRERLVENVDLIVTIPRRWQEDLREDVINAFEKAPFDRKLLAKTVRDRYGSTGYNLRRIARDQTNKTVSGLTRLRHSQLQIHKYEWSTSMDERVRSAHRLLQGTVQRWDSPPEGGHPGWAIQCRCVAIPYFD